MNATAVGGPIVVLHDHLDGGVRPQTVLDLAAEHGVGRLKTQELIHYKSEVAVTLMRGIKQALDPNNVMNPGVVLSTTDP